MPGMPDGQSTPGTSSHLTSISIQHEWLVHLWGCMDRGRTQQRLGKLESFLTSERPLKLNLWAMQRSERGNHCGKVSTKPTIVPHHTQETRELFLCCQNRKLINCQYFCSYWAHLPLANYFSQDKASFCHRRDEAEFRSTSKRRIRSISGPSTKPLQQMNQRYPAQAMTSSPNSGDSLTACTPRNTTRDSLDFPKIRATRASNTAEVTATDRHLVFDLMSSPGS
ncbi:unnamed protein product [Pleuronectes platessa]|uniref:Uncharacterized protein n=1 Tax=Pleuronectes platessa TaxID=8262 RepID=A0A9N7YA73_PLEPL|nr:unnamed protein product [Pleuronectes platessa]